MGRRREGTRTTWLLRKLRSIPERSADQGDVSGDSAACSGARGRVAPPTWIDRGDIYPDPGGLLQEHSVTEGHAYVANVFVEDLSSSCQGVAGTVATNDGTVFAGYACTHYTPDLPEDARYSWTSRVVALEGRQVVWQWDGPPDMQVLRVLAAPDGRIVVLGLQQGGDGGRQALSLFVLDPSGELEWSRTYSDDNEVPSLNRDPSGRWTVNTSALTPDGHVLVGAIVHRLTPEASRTYWVGELRWTE